MEVREDFSSLMSGLVADKDVVWAVALSFKSRGRKFAGGRAVPVK